MVNRKFSMPEGDPFAGFWRRAGAWFVDAFLIYAVYLFIAFFVWDDLLTKQVIEDPAGGASLSAYAPTLLGLLMVGVAVWAYLALQECSKAQATLGKRLFGLRVCNYNGDRISLLTASYRTWPLWLPGLINSVAILDLIISLAALAACLSVAFTKQKQGLHDMMAGCLVVKRRAVFSDPPPSI
jgi:uncharacterized RDD family membrane protein YckC